MVQLQFGGKPCILLQNTCTTTYQVATCVKQSIRSHKQAACSGKNFKEIIFVVEVNSTKTAKFIVLENFPLYGILKKLWCLINSEHTIETYVRQKLPYVVHNDLLGSYVHHSFILHILLKLNYFSIIQGR